MTFALQHLSARYVATFNNEHHALNGTWHQGRSSWPLVFTQDPAPAPPQRPQTPQPPFPYRSEPVAFDNPSGPSHLTGTLTLPQGPGPFAAVLLITGSGLQDRDETMFGHKPFLIWADTLTRRGIAVLRVDDRQKGGSTGPVLSATIRDFALDTEAGFQFLRHHPEIDPKRIGLMGHSEGGSIAAMIAAKNKNVAFIILLETPALPGRQIILAQREWAMARMGAPPEAIHQSNREFDTIMSSMTTDQSQREADRAADRTWNGLHNTQDRLPQTLRPMTSPALRTFYIYDPAPDLAQVDCPVLAVMGDKDRQVPVTLNLPALRKTLAHSTRAQISVLADLNHLLQKAATGDASEYGKIEEDIDPTALSVVTDWILAQSRTRPSARSISE